MREKKIEATPDMDTAVEASTRTGMVKRLLVVLSVVVVVLAAAVGGGLWWHEQPSFCSTICHSTMAPYYASYQNKAMLAGVHAKADVTCLDCHEATPEEQLTELQSQVSGDYKSPLKQREFKTEFCGGEECHGKATMKSMAKVTIKMKPNPHDNHKTLGAKCTSCHNMHTAQKTPCKKCHEKGWGFPF